MNGPLPPWLEPSLDAASVLLLIGIVVGTLAAVIRGLT
jgi:hypothetical protein